VTSSFDAPGRCDQRRLLLVHAHPDDESIGTGATMAKYAAAGARVTLVTCTLGELGEIIPPGLAHLAADREDRLGEHRIGEVAAACQALGVTDHRFLGGAGRWRDSGMMGTPDNDDPRCFWRADVDVAARELAAVIREVRPHVMVTYDDNGFYGHPDHIQAHRVAWRAFQLAGDPTARVLPGRTAGDRSAARNGCAPAWQVSKFYATATPRSALARAIEAMCGDAACGDGRVPEDFVIPGGPDDLPGVPDEQVTTEIDASACLGAKLAAMRAHATQITVDGTFYALSNHVAQRASGVEYYTLLAGPLMTAPPDSAAGPHGQDGRDGREDDLFAGVAGAGVAGAGVTGPGVAGAGVTGAGVGGAGVGGAGVGSPPAAARGPGDATARQAG
jgi:N-acetyl-1-D-myo-inositol-2-amino-2-deoxy-alpha-D-glucopyranoside deacetylase